MRIRFSRFSAFFAGAVFFLFLINAGPVSAFEETVEGRGFFMAGITGMDIGNLNNSLKTNGYTAFPETFASFGGGGFAVLGKFLLGGEGFGAMSGSESGSIGGELFKTSLRGGYGLFKVGYIMYRRAGFIIYPSVGFGGGGLALDISKQETVSFDDILKSPKRRTTLSCGFFLLDLGVGADNLVVLDRTESGEEGGIAFGIRAGYLLAPYRSDWGDAINGPDAAIEGAYFRVTIGGGGYKLK